MITTEIKNCNMKWNNIMPPEFAKNIKRMRAFGTLTIYMSIYTVNTYVSICHRTARMSTLTTATERVAEKHQSPSLTCEINGDNVAAFVVCCVGEFEVPDFEDVPRSFLEEAVLLLVDGKIESLVAQR